MSAMPPSPMPLVEIGAEQGILFGAPHLHPHFADDVGDFSRAPGACSRRGLNSFALTRTDTQARQFSQAGR